MIEDNVPIENEADKAIAGELLKKNKKTPRASAISSVQLGRPYLISYVKGGAFIILTEGNEVVSSRLPSVVASVEEEVVDADADDDDE